MTSVFDELALADELPPDLPDEPHAPSPAASRPAAATATSPLCVRCLLLMSAFPVSELPVEVVRSRLIPVVVS